jgi:hypothetical protein
VWKRVSSPVRERGGELKGPVPMSRVWCVASRLFGRRKRSPGSDSRLSAYFVRTPSGYWREVDAERDEADSLKVETAQSLALLGVTALLLVVGLLVGLLVGVSL